MEIHDLNTKTLTDPAYIAFDDGTDTYKAEFNDAVEGKAAAAVAAADLTQNAVAFTSGDAASPTAWTSVSVITSGSTLATLFNRISTMVKNVRYLWSLIGTSSFQNVANTLSGAIGNTALTTTATTLSGAIAEHETDISTLNGKTTDALLIKQYNKQYTIAANSALNLMADDFGVSTPSGYTPIGAIQFTSGNGDIYVRAINAAATGQNGMLYLKNTRNSEITVTAYMQILYAKSVLF